MSREMAQRQVLWQVQPLDLAWRSSLLGLKDQETATLPSMTGQSAKILAYYGDANSVLLWTRRATEA